MDMKRYTNIFEKRPEIQDLDAHAPDEHYSTTTTHDAAAGMHKHDLYVTAEEMTHLHASNNNTVTVFTTENNGHQHELTLRVDPAHKYALRIVDCDNTGKPVCWDHHYASVYHQNN